MWIDFRELVRLAACAFCAIALLALCIVLAGCQRPAKEGEDMTGTAEACCDDCGDDVRIVTTAPQQPNGGGWCAYDGDEGACVSCGLRHYVHIDDSGSDVTAWLSAEVSQ